MTECHTFAINFLKRHVWNNTKSRGFIVQCKILQICYEEHTKRHFSIMIHRVHFRTPSEIRVGALSCGNSQRKTSSVRDVNWQTVGTPQLRRTWDILPGLPSSTLKSASNLACATIGMAFRISAVFVIFHGPLCSVENCKLDIHAWKLRGWVFCVSPSYSLAWSWTGNSSDRNTFIYRTHLLVCCLAFFCGHIQWSKRSGIKKRFVCYDKKTFNAKETEHFCNASRFSLLRIC